jgi:hypothetical protein
MLGLTGLLRYEFLFAQAFVPYIQLGVGILYSDIYKDRSQDLIGNEINFNPQLAIGLRYPIGEAISVNMEGAFQHISNGGLNSERNIGVNGVGVLIGVRWKLS